MISYVFFSLTEIKQYVFQPTYVFISTTYALCFWVISFFPRDKIRLFHDAKWHNLSIYVVPVVSRPSEHKQFNITERRMLKIIIFMTMSASVVLEMFTCTRFKAAMNNTTEVLQPYFLYLLLLFCFLFPPFVCYCIWYYELRSNLMRKKCFFSSTMCSIEKEVAIFRAILIISVSQSQLPRVIP